MIFSCGENEKDTKNTEENEENLQKEEKLQTKKAPCDDVFSWGDLDICLPKIDGMIECYSSPNIKEYFNQFSDIENKTTFGFYLKNNVYNDWEKSGISTPPGPLDEYFKFFVVNEAKEFEIGINDMRLAMIEVESMYQSIYDDVKENYPRVGVPVFVESYFPEENVVSHVIMSKRKDGLIQVSISNSINIKNRWIWMGYIKTYDSKESIKHAKSRSEQIISQFSIDNH